MNAKHPSGEDYQRLSNLLVQKNIRQLVFVQGDTAWQHAQIHQWLASHPRTPLTGLWIQEESSCLTGGTSPISSERTHTGDADIRAKTEAQIVSIRQLSRHLGETHDFIVFNAREGIDANALAQASGMIRGGGVLWIAVETGWTKLPNPACTKFLSYPLTLSDSLGGFYPFIKDGLKAHALWLCETSDWQGALQQKCEALSHACSDAHNTATLPSLPSGFSSQHPAHSLPKNLNSTYLVGPTTEQAAAIERLLSVAEGHRRRPLLIHADRGRGKSAVLGMGAVEAIVRGKTRVLIVATRAEQVASAMVHAQSHAQALGATVVDAHAKGVHLDTGSHHGQLQFVPPDALVDNPALDADLVMIDEAAQLPLPRLQAWVTAFSRVVIASTDHGYEGSGRSFRLRFAQYLSDTHPGWKALHLLTPIRWAPNDPMEDAVQQALWLHRGADETGFSRDQQNASNKTPGPAESLTELSFTKLKTIGQPLTASKDLKAAFELLINAHYQTSPNDLMQWLDVPDQIIWLAHQRDNVVGVVLVQEEGGLPLPQPNQRFQGHLFPQLLWRQSHNTRWLHQRTGRIQRIAVSPEVRGLGIGTALLEQVKEDALNRGWDTLSVSFGATAELIAFWHTRGFSSLHLGLKRDKASATYSLAMALPLSDPSNKTVNEAHYDFQRVFAWQLSDGFTSLSTETVIALILTGNYTKTDFPKRYLNTTNTQPDMPFERVAPWLFDWTLGNVACLDQWPPLLRTAWIQKVIQRQPWQTVVANTHYSSRAQLEAAFRTHLETVFR